MASAKGMEAGSYFRVLEQQEERGNKPPKDLKHQVERVGALL